MPEGDTPSITSETSRPASDPADEALIFQVFDVELRDVLRRLADSISAFIERIEISFSRHAILPCRCSHYDDPHARGAWHRVQALRGDAVALLDMTVRHYGQVYPKEREPFTCERVTRPPLLSLATIPTRTHHQAELLGWLTPNEQLLNAILKLGIVVLEERAKVSSRQLGLFRGRDADGKERISADPALAESDQSISRYYPLLIRPELGNCQMAIAEANLQDLREKVPRLLAWRPVLESSRILDPGWPCLVHSYMRVVNSERRHSQDPPPPTELPPEPEKVARGVGRGDSGDTNPNELPGSGGETPNAKKLNQAPSAPSPVLPLPETQINDDAVLPVAELAKVFGVELEPLRKRLERWRSRNQNGWIESANPNSREPKFLYRVAAVRQIALDLRASGEASAKRPSEK